MIAKVKLVGTGTGNDPYRVDLPDYQLLHGNITHGYAIVNIPNHVHGLTDEELASESTEDTTEGKLYVALSDATRQKLHSNLDEKYHEHKGKFRVENSS